MAKKTIGYIELEWTCPNCGNKNPGMQKTCGSCGSPQPESAQFEVGQNQKLVDEQKSNQAAKGPDIHCPYCQTRNQADAKECIQCGGDLREGARRQSGRVLSAPTLVNNARTCPNCGSLNTTGSATCQSCGASLAGTTPPKPSTPAASSTQPSAFRPWMLLPIIAVLGLCCVVIGLLFFRTTSLTGVVQSTSWRREIAIQEQQPVIRETWRDQLPGSASILSCEQAYRGRQDNPAPGAREVCATALIDQGNGSAKVEETCYYEIYDDFCKYQVLEWQTVDQATAQGTDLQPYWPQVSLSTSQREGPRTENYSINFETSDGQKEFTTSDAGFYSQFLPGSQWNLSVNTLGGIVEVTP